MKTKLILNIVLLFFVINLMAQSDVPTDYLSADFHKSRREALRSSMPENSVAVFFSNAIRNRANDVDFVYHQDPNFYYLTGLKEPHSVLVIFSENQQQGDKTFNETLYVYERGARYKIYNGEGTGVKGAKEQLGFSNVYGGQAFIDDPIDFSKFDKVMFKEFEDDVRKKGREQPNLYALIEQFKSSINTIPMPAENKIDAESAAAQSIVDTKSLRTLMAGLREIKSKEELKLIKKAVEISCVGQIEVMKAMHPGMSETETQGIHEMVFKKYGSEYEGYPSIVGAGNNGCVLHYVDNNKLNVGNELVLMDLGAEYRGYTADVTRTIPANGKFTKEQKIIYDLVYDAQEAGIASMVIGNDYKKVDMVARDVIYKGLLALGITDSLHHGYTYFPHGTSHHIGLDVHDLNNRGSFKENMILTVEPGIYIPEGSKCDEKWWGIAVRIEDDVLVTKNGPVNYSALAPRKSEDIEKMMAEESIFDKFQLPDLDAEE
ncbi:aminopeptidase P family protein [Lutimonas vermicola]|uniref:Xaa-Pro aminopeptidase n=1 Tax=Lutimonas vermicola TaxID=414288 RepID=A0ABU9KXT1_9FLAO